MFQGVLTHSWIISRLCNFGVRQFEVQKIFKQVWVYKNKQEEQMRLQTNIER